VADPVAVAAVVDHANCSVVCIVVMPHRQLHMLTLDLYNQIVVVEIQVLTSIKRSGTTTAMLECKAQSLAVDVVTAA
jgi:hypothetical protein